MGGRELVQERDQNIDYRLFGNYPDDTRPDAVEDFGNENYRYVGFECTVDAQRLREEGEFKVIGISSDGKSYTVATFLCTAA